MLGYGATTSRSISMRSSTVNRLLLVLLMSTADDDLVEDWSAARTKTSRCPLVTGSKDPGQTALRTQTSSRCPGSAGATPNRRRDRTKAPTLHPVSPYVRVACRARIRRARRTPSPRRGSPAPRRTSDAVGEPAVRRETGEHRPRPRRRRRRRAGRAKTRSYGATARRRRRGRGEPTSRRSPSTTAPGEADGGDVGPHDLERLAVLLDEQHVRGAARERLEPDGAGAGVEVEQPDARRARRARDSIALNSASRTRSEVGRVRRTAARRSAARAPTPR